MRRLLCSLLAALMLLPWVMQGAWAAGGTREVKSREIAVVFDNSGSMYDAGNTAWCGAGYAVEMDPVHIFPINRDKENAVISRLFSMFSINLVQAKSSKNKGF